MNIVSGKILVEGTKYGLHGLVISLLYLDANSRFNVERLTSNNIDFLHKSTSLGSDISDSNGSFCIEYDPKDIEESNQNRRIRFVLVVFLADSPEKPTKEEILHVSSRIRSKVGRTEKFLIEIPLERARAAGLAIGEPGIPAELASPAIVKDISNRTTIRHNIEKSVKTLVQERLKSERKKHQEKRKIVRNFIKEKAERGFKMPDGTLADNYVDDGQTITEVSRRVIKRNLNTINKSTVSGILSLDKKKLAEVLDENGDVRENLSSEKIEALIIGKEEERQHPPLIFLNEIDTACRDRTKPYDRCADVTEETESEAESIVEAESTESDLVPATMEEFKKNLSLILDTITKNSLSPHLYTQSRPTPDQVYSLFRFN